MLSLIWESSRRLTHIAAHEFLEARIDLSLAKRRCSGKIRRSGLLGDESLKQTERKPRSDPWLLSVQASDKGK